MRLALLAGCLLAVAPCSAQTATTPGAPGAEAVVGAYVDAFAAGQHVKAAGHLDPAELAAFTSLLDRMGKQAGTPLVDVAPGADPAQVFAAFLRQITGAEPLMGEAFETMRAQVLGSVAEGDSLRHVVVRSAFEMDGVPTGGVQATTARWTGTRWVVTFDERMRQFQRTLEAAIAGGDQ